MEKHDATVVVIGGATADIDGFVEHELIARTSNPGKIKVSSGGVGRNIAENLVRLGINTKLITALGNDTFGKQVLDDCTRCGMDTQHIILPDGYTTSMYIALHNQQKEMVLAVSQLDALEAINPAFIQKYSSVIRNAALVVLDTNLMQETIEFLLTRFPDTVFFIDPVSVSKAMKIKPFLKHCHTIKPSKNEAEVLTGIPVHDNVDLEKSLQCLLSAGVKNVFISLGKEGVAYSDTFVSGRFAPLQTKIISDTGAGDAFMAGLVYGYLQRVDCVQSCKIAMAAASLALSHENTVNPNLSIDLIEERMKQF